MWLIYDVCCEQSMELSAYRLGLTISNMYIQDSSLSLWEPNVLSASKAASGSALRGYHFLKMGRLIVQIR